MRPKRLELEGFASFRERTVVDFEDTSLFVFTGPTGAGKSSLVDAITFALYGCVPRYEDKRLVAPVITQGLLEAKVRLDFSIGNESYTAVRVVRRSKSGGATTKEARLEHGDQVLAGNESELSEKVQSLIGLTFEHFTKCVVLPQGEFAQFLRDKPRDRQALLVRLLDIGVYGNMAKLARARHQHSSELATLNQERLKEDFQHATPERRRESKQQLARIEKLNREVEQAQPRLRQLAEQVGQFSQQTEQIQKNLEALRSVKIPKEVADLEKRSAELEKEEKRLEHELTQTGQQLQQLDAQVAQLPDKVETAQLLEARKRLQQSTRQAVAEEESVASLTAAEAERTEKLKSATKQRAEAQQRLEAARDAHAAAHLAVKLEPGRPCPVCAQPVAKVPKITPPADLEKSQSALTEAEERVRRAESAQRLAREELRVQVARADETRQTLAQLQQQLSGKPSAEELERSLRQWTELEQKRAQTRARENEIREAEQGLRTRRRQLETVSTKAQADFHAVRDALIALHPPAVAAPDPVRAWGELQTWATAQIPSQENQLKTASEQSEKLEQQQGEIEKALREACLQAGLESGDRSLVAATTEALLAAQAQHQQLLEDLEKARQLRSRIKELKADAVLAREMSALLGSRGFERWYLNRAMRQLVAGASLTLRELSSSQYSLALDERGNDFLVVDHNSADERRLARTLSGGETFLASLSLALALSDHVASLSARGAARLEAIFLDEGFGTLDSETLETVAAAIDELGERGRMVGLITHVRELANQIPVRYQVSKDAHTSSVQRLLQ